MYLVDLACDEQIKLNVPQTPRKTENVVIEIECLFFFLEHQLSKYSLSSESRKHLLSVMCLPLDPVNQKVLSYSELTSSPPILSVMVPRPAWSPESEIQDRPCTHLPCSLSLTFGVKDY